MNTIENNIEISGFSLMDGQESIVKITPSIQKGIYFYPQNSEVPVKACLENVISTQNCVVLGRNNMQVRLVEHFMAACALTGIDSINVHMSTSELPILDGSALQWFNAFNNAGIKKNSSQHSIKIEQPVCYSFDKVNLVMIPAEEFQVSYCVNFNHPDFENKWKSWKVSEHPTNIVQARTFGYLKDLERFQQAGLALGVSIDNTIGLTESGYTTELRTKYELIEHKILDIIGDLNLMEINPLSLKAHIIAQEAGHKSHVDFAKIINNYVESTKCQQVMK